MSVTASRRTSLEKLGLSRTTRTYNPIGGGYGGAIPNLQVAESLLGRNGDGVVVSASVEICSAMLQMDNDINLIPSIALFGEGKRFFQAALWN